MKTETLVIHAGEKKAHFEGAVSVPIFQSANFITASETDYHRIKYIRLNNTPNHEVLHKKLADLEHGEDAVVTASGMGAIATALLTVLKPGDHVLAQACLYGGTLSLFLNDFNDLGISVSYINIYDSEKWKNKLRSNTKAVYVESISNPLTEVGDLERVVAFAKSHNLVSLIDNTVASPYYFQPLRVGFDIVLHSATKYLNGHSDIVAGAVVSSRYWIERVKHRLDHLGACLDPHACFLLNRGLKTFVLRMRQHEKNALLLAEFLEQHPKVEKVFYPGLKSHPDHERATRLFSGYSGLLSFEIKKNADYVNQFIARLQLPLVAPSLGGVETLITRPATTSHLSLSPKEREKIGISDTLIRVSVGIENSDDLIEDFKQALV